MSKYRQIAHDAQAELVPFVVSSFGGYGGGAMRLFSMLREAVAAMDPVPWSSDPVGDLIRDLCIIAQRGNGMAVTMGWQRADVILQHQRLLGLAARDRDQPPAGEHRDLVDV